jgi:hypothetical protein
MRRLKRWVYHICRLGRFGDANSNDKDATQTPILQPLFATRTRVSRHARCIDG